MNFKSTKQEFMIQLVLAIGFVTGSIFTAVFGLLYSLGTIWVSVVIWLLMWRGRK